MNHFIRSALLLIQILVFSYPVFAAKVTATVDATNINKSDVFTFKIETEGVDTSPKVDITPILNDFSIVSGPSQQTNISWVNGKMKSSRNLTWTLSPSKTGILTIPSLKVMFGEKTFRTKPIKIKVSQGKALSTSGDLFLTSEIDKSEVYLGEQITVTYKIYTKVNISIEDLELPKFVGFWTEELFAAKNLQLREVQKNGSKYHAATIKKLALFPTQSGKLIINPLTAVIGIREKQQRWNDFSLFGPPSKKYTIATNQIELEVQPLPDRKTGELSAVVGNWNIRSIISSANVVQDEAITLQVKVTGTGNIQTVDISNISFPNELEIFEPKIQTQENPLRDKIGGEKTFEWVLIPRYAGEIFIPIIQFSYFDPSKQMWLTKSTTGHHLKVAPNEKAVIYPIGLSKEEVALVGQDIRFIDKSEPKWRNSNKGLVTGMTLTLLLLSSMVFVFPHAHNYSLQRMEQKSGGRRSKRALNSAMNILDSKNDLPEEIYTDIYKAVITFINMKTGKNKVEYSTGEIKKLLDKHDKTENLQEVEQILTRGEAVRFSPISCKDAKKDVLKIIVILKKIDGSWT